LHAPPKSYAVELSSKRAEVQVAAKVFQQLNCIISICTMSRLLYRFPYHLFIVSIDE
jgi:hypothetical protein